MVFCDFFFGENMVLAEIIDFAENMVFAENIIFADNMVFAKKKKHDMF